MYQRLGQNIAKRLIEKDTTQGYEDKIQSLCRKLTVLIRKPIKKFNRAAIPSRQKKENDCIGIVVMVQPVPPRQGAAWLVGTGMPSAHILDQPVEIIEEEGAHQTKLCLSLVETSGPATSPTKSAAGACRASLSRLPPCR